MTPPNEEITLFCFYVVYQTEKGTSWRVINTPLNLDYAEDLVEWIKEEENKTGNELAPIFWKKLETGSCSKILPAKNRVG